MHKSPLQKTEEYVLSILSDRTPVNNSYHDLAHTQNVVDACIEIGLGEKLTPDEMEMIQIAAWFHDTGYVEKSTGHEEISGMFASNFLSEENYPSEKIDIIIKCILATKVPQIPKSKLEKILCDADLSHLGKTTFFVQNDKYRFELEKNKGRKLSEYEWLTTTIDFVTRHHFFTEYAIRNLAGKKNENLKALQEQLDNVINHSSKK